MKKMICILLSMVMALSLAACGGAEKPADEKTQETSGENSGETSAEWTRQGYFQDENENMLTIRLPKIRIIPAGP